MRNSMQSENIKTIGRLAYVKLFDWPVDWPDAKRVVSMSDGEYHQLFWRFYWRAAIARFGKGGNYDKV